MFGYKHVTVCSNWDSSLGKTRLLSNLNFDMVTQTHVEWTEVCDNGFACGLTIDNKSLVLYCLGRRAVDLWLTMLAPGIATMHSALLTFLSFGGDIKLLVPGDLV